MSKKNSSLGNGNELDLLNLVAFRDWKNNSGDDNSERMERLMRNLPKAMDKLSERQRLMIELRYIKNMKGIEIAEQLGVNASTVSRTLKRAKKSLRKMLEFSL